MKILIDNGHGAETPGKRSPDGKLREWKYTREIARRVVEALVADGYDAELLVPEDIDVPLKQRCKRANDMHRKQECILVSIHVNAAGLGDKWMVAHGWGAYIAPNGSTWSRLLANALAEAAEGHGLWLRRPSRKQKYWEASFAICRDTTCPAVLTENMFMDNEGDCAWLLSEGGKCALVNLHVEGIKRVIPGGMRVENSR